MDEKFHSEKCIWKYRLQIGGHFAQVDIYIYIYTIVSTNRLANQTACASLYTKYVVSKFTNANWHHTVSQTLAYDFNKMTRGAKNLFFYHQNGLTISIKPLPKPTLTYCHLGLCQKKITTSNFEHIILIFIDENVIWKFSLINSWQMAIYWRFCYEAVGICYFITAHAYQVDRKTTINKTDVGTPKDPRPP